MADQIIQRAFTGGELAPSLRSRADLTKYQTGLALCENFIVRPQGGVYSRPGFKFVGEINDSALKGRLIPFSFNVEQTYMLVFENLLMHVIKDAGYVLDGGGPALFSLVTPYTTADLPRLIFTQDADVMTITRWGHDPQALTRTDHDAWTLTAINYASSVSPPSAAPTLATVGAGAGSNNKKYTYVVTAVDNNGIESVATSSKTIDTPSLSVTAGVRVTWLSVTGAIFYRVYKDPSDATGIFGWIGDSVNLTFDDFNIAPVVSDSPPVDNFPFSGASDKPACVGYYQQRQIFANTVNEAQTVFTTQSGVYNSLRSSNPARDDDAIIFTIKGKQVNEIRHIVAVDSLILLTSGAEWKITEGVDQVMTPTTLGARIQSYYGCSYTAPLVIGNSIIFIQSKGNRVRDIKYEFIDDKFTGTDLSIMSEHLFKGFTIDETAYEEEPFGIAWMIRSDGTLLGLTYQKEHEVWAWHRHVTDGDFESVATITEGGRDATYVIVKRTIDGNTVRYVERMEERFDDLPKNAYCIDSGISYNGVPADVMTGLDHLEGEEVTVNADGNEVTGLTVSSGQITLPNEASIVHVGLKYTPAIETLDIDTGNEVLKGKEISLSNVMMEVENSRGGHVGPIDADGVLGEMLEIKPRFQDDEYDAIPLKTFKQSLVISPGWSKGGRMRIEQRSPFPLAILSLVPDIDIS